MMTMTTSFGVVVPGPMACKDTVRGITLHEAQELNDGFLQCTVMEFNNTFCTAWSRNHPHARAKPRG